VEEEYHRNQEGARLKIEQIARRALRRDIWSFDSDSDELPSSPTWDEEQLAMIQAEADFYVISPKAGSG